MGAELAALLASMGGTAAMGAGESLAGAGLASAAAPSFGAGLLGGGSALGAGEMLGGAGLMPQNGFMTGLLSGMGKMGTPMQMAQMGAGMMDQQQPMGVPGKPPTPGPATSNADVLKAYGLGGGGGMGQPPIGGGADIVRARMAGMDPQKYLEMLRRQMMGGM